MRKGTSTRGALGGAFVCLLVASLFSGCLGDDDVPAPGAPDLDDSPPADVFARDGRDLRTDLTASDQLPAPAWTVGDWWGIHVYFGSQGGEGQHIDVVVTEAGPASYALATDSKQMAKQHALFDLPVLGAIKTDDLAMTGFGGTWDWFHFPLTDGATWQGEIPNIAFDVLPAGQVPLTFTATYADDLDVEGEMRPGYRVEGTTEDGTLLVAYTYAPSIRWFTSATVYDIDPNQDPVEFTFALMGHGRGWTGTYYVDEARVLIDNADGSGLSSPPPEGTPFAEPSPHATFTVGADATYLYGFVENQAVLGTRQTIIVPPEGEPRRTEAVGTPDHFMAMRIDEPAMPGEWRLATTGAGGYSYGHVLIAEIIERAGSI